MRQTSLVVLIIVALLFMPLAPTALKTDLDSKNSNGRSSFICEEFDFPVDWDGVIVDGAFTINDGECTVLKLEGITGNEILDINIVANDAYAIDSLMMDSGVYYSYWNEQPYHINPLSGSYLIERGPSIENLTGSIEYTWSVPSNEDFFLVLDNMRHPADEGRGAGGGNSIDVSVAITLDEENWLWKPYDSIIQLDSETNQIFNDQPIYFDEGDAVTIRSTPTFGNSDIYLMTDEQYNLYSTGSPGTWHIADASMVSVSNTNQIDWTVSSEYAGIPLHIVVDNQATPAGGGSGTNAMATTIAVLVNPALSPLIEITSHNSTEIELGESMQFDASTTPNRWQQISNYNWDIAGIGSLSGTIANAKWEMPGEYAVELEIVRVDGQNESKMISISVLDTVKPDLRIIGISDGTNIEQSSELTLTCDCSDNHEINNIEWIWDAVSDSSSGLTYDVTTSQLGSHDLTVRVTDMSGNTAEINLTINIVDATGPELISVSWPNENLIQGSELDFSIKANDPEDSNLIFRWDLDLSTDTNNDGNKRNDWIIGAYDTSTNEAKMSYTFSTPGVYNIMVQVVNSENRKLELTHSIAISEPAPTETSSIVYASGGIVLLGLLGAGTYVAWRTIQQRISNIEAEGKNLTPEEQAELKQQQLSQQLYGDAQNDLANVANIGNSEQQWSRPQTQQVNYHQIAGIPESVTPQPNPIQRSSGVGDDMLNALIDDPTPTVEQPKEIDDDLAFLKDMKKSPTEKSKSVDVKVDPVKSTSQLKIDIPGITDKTEIVKKKTSKLMIDLPELPKLPDSSNKNTEIEDIDL